MTCYKQGLFDLVAVPGATQLSSSGRRMVVSTFA